MCDEDNDSRKYSSDNLSYQFVPDADRELAVQALQEFEQQNYEQSLNLLKKLISKRPKDSKVFHNYCVAEYYLSSCKKTDQFNKKIADLSKQARIDIQNLESLDDIDNCVVLYNQSVALYHFHQYHSAIYILDKVFQFIEPLEENLARNICFLLLECYLSIYQPKKALCLVGYIETVMFAENKNCNKFSQKEDNNENGMSEVLRRKLQLCKARCYAMMRTSKACKKEIKSLLSSGSTSQNISVFYLKSQLEYQRGNYRKALKLLNSVTIPDVSKYFWETGDCLPAAFYNNVGCIHFYMGKPNLGHFYTKKALTELDAEIIKICDLLDNKHSTLPLHLLNISIPHQLMYNIGIHYLQAKKFYKAFTYFVEVVKSYHSNPRLWLRIAECCIHINKPDCMDEYVECKKRSFVKSKVSAGPHSKLIMYSSTLDKQSSEEAKNSSNLESPSLQYAMLCLKNALFLVGEHCSTNSTSDSVSSIQSSSEDTDTATSEENILAVLPANFLQGSEILSLRNSILAACSYVALSLGDVVLAHEYAKTLLSQPHISAAHKFLAHQYAGESLLIMDRITEAVEHFNYQCADEIELATPVSSSEISLKHQMRFVTKSNEKNDDGSRLVGNIPNWLPNTISTGKFVSQYNLAVAYAVREEWNKAMECLSQMNPNGKVPPQALALLIYVESHSSAEGIKATVQQYVSPNFV